MKKATMKAKRSDARYIDTFITHGNTKLKDYYNPDIDTWYRYAQFNIPARITCPYATPDCIKFCYAKRDERFPSPRINREKNFAISRTDIFADRLIYTIAVEKQSRRYSNAVMIVRIHESGDFYNIKYLRAWLKTFDAFPDNDGIIFQMYTKSFKFFMNLSDAEKNKLLDLMKAGRVAISLSLDDSMKATQRADLVRVKAALPLCNIYYAVKESKLSTVEYNSRCDCADCARCGHCVKTTGATVAVAIH